MDGDKETVLLCHAGVRSRNVAGILAHQVNPKLSRSSLAARRRLVDTVCR